MAGQSAKKQVASNTKILKEIHRVTGASFAVFAFFIFVVRRPGSWKPFVFFALPALLSLYILEKTGRPLVDAAGKVVRTGQDLQQEGLTEYFFDVIYLTVILNILSIVFNSTKVWWLYIVVPGFAAYKLYALVNYGKQLFGGGKSSAVTEPTPAEDQKSNRQKKLEKRGDKPKTKYR